MYKYSDKPLLKSEADYIFIPITTEPLLIQGFALEAKILYPEIKPVIEESYKKGNLKLGSTIFIRTNDYKRLICIPDRRDNKTIPNLQYVTHAIKSLRRFILDHQVESLSIPIFGVDQGGLTWTHVKCVLDEYIKDIENLNVFIHEGSIY